ncbi:hypothetical protein Tco_0554697 [Tanacetum coccineum]
MKPNSPLWWLEATRTLGGGLPPKPTHPFWWLLQPTERTLDGGSGGDDDVEVVVTRWRMAASGLGDRIDRVTRSIFGFSRKSPPEKFSGGSDVVAGGGSWPEEGGCLTWERREGDRTLLVVRGCDGDDDGGGVASLGGSRRKGWRVEESDYGDRIDQAIRTIFGFGRRSHRKSFSVAGDGGGGGGGVAGGGRTN